MRRFTEHAQSANRRDGTTIVETAVIMPVFLIFLFALIEFGHAFMCTEALTAAAKDAARYGAIPGVTTAQVIARANQRISGAFKSAKATVFVKDASTFESSNTNTATVNVSTLPNINVESAKDRQLYIVRVEVPYNNIAIMPPLWAKNLTLHGESVMRHE